MPLTAPDVLGSTSGREGAVLAAAVPVDAGVVPAPVRCCAAGCVVAAGWRDWVLAGAGWVRLSAVCVGVVRLVLAGVVEAGVSGSRIR
jgi:ABC-type enterobactin transport system permease subunit